jgi:hypothetical protein
MRFVVHGESSHAVKRPSYLKRMRLMCSHRAKCGIIAV